MGNTRNGKSLERVIVKELRSRVVLNDSSEVVKERPCVDERRRSPSPFEDDTGHNAAHSYVYI